MLPMKEKQREIDAYKRYIERQKVQRETETYTHRQRETEKYREIQRNTTRYREVQKETEKFKKRQRSTKKRDREVQ